MVKNTLPASVTRTAALLLAGVVAALAIGCDPLPDMMAIRNDTADELTVTLQVDIKFVSDDCDSHEDPVEFDVDGDAPIAPGRRRCFSGDGPGDTEDARNHISHIRIVRNGTACIDETGEALKLRPFIDERYQDTLVVDDTVCP